jgi:cell division protease FtsH
VNFSRNAALWIFIVLLLFVLFNLFQGTANRGAADPLVFSDFVQQVEDGQVRDVTIQGQEITGHFNDGRSFETVAPDGINSNLVPTLEAWCRRWKRVACRSRWRSTTRSTRCCRS